MEYKFKGTPGPWAATLDNEQRNKYSGVCSKRLSVNFGDTTVCTVWATGEFRHTDTSKNPSTDAHLIAAAPELLNACIAMVEACNKNNLTEVVPEHEMMITAIHKALNIQP